VTSSLKERALQGGLYLALRQLVSVILSLVSVLVVARTLGPASYGIYAVAAGLLYFAIETGRLGLDVYLIRAKELPEDAPEQLLGFFATVGTPACLLLTCLLPLTGSWTDSPEMPGVLQALVPVLWLALMAGVPIAVLERQMRFDQVGLAEAVAQIVNCMVTIALVFAGWNFWGPVVGLGVQFALLTALAFRFCPLRPRLFWRTDFVAVALRQSLLYVGANWIWALRSLTVPVLLSRLAGLEAVGVVSIAVRLAEQLGVLRNVAYRLSISTLARLGDDTAAVRRAISRGLTYQGLMVGPLYAVFSCLAPWVVPLLFGDAWLTSTRIFPFVALGILVNTVFNLHSSALYAAGRNGEVAVFHLWHVALLWSAVWLLVPTFGLWGFAAAEVVALLSYLSIHRSLVRLCGTPAYGDSLWLLATTVPVLLAGPWLAPWLGLLLVALCYALLFSLRPGIQGIPSELINAWRNRRQSSAVA
jgi:PST family polysaccharide transporter